MFSVFCVIQETGLEPSYLNVLALGHWCEVHLYITFNMMQVILEANYAPDRMPPEATVSMVQNLSPYPRSAILGGYAHIADTHLAIQLGRSRLQDLLCQSRPKCGNF